MQSMLNQSEASEIFLHTIAGLDIKRFLTAKVIP